MWNFSNLAKQAQELTEKATASSGLFNLDAMQNSTDTTATSSNNNNSNNNNNYESSFSMNPVDSTLAAASIFGFSSTTPRVEMTSTAVASSLSSTLSFLQTTTKEPLSPNSNQEAKESMSESLPSNLRNNSHTNDGDMAQPTNSSKPTPISLEKAAPQANKLTISSDVSKSAPTPQPESSSILKDSKENDWDPNVWEVDDEIIDVDLQESSLPALSSTSSPTIQVTVEESSGKNQEKENYSQIPVISSSSIPNATSIFETIPIKSHSGLLETSPDHTSNLLENESEIQKTILPESVPSVSSFSEGKSESVEEAKGTNLEALHASSSIGQDDYNTQNEVQGSVENQTEHSKDEDIAKETEVQVWNQDDLNDIYDDDDDDDDDDHNDDDLNESDNDRCEEIDEPLELHSELKSQALIQDKNNTPEELMDEPKKSSTEEEHIVMHSGGEEEFSIANSKSSEGLALISQQPKCTDEPLEGNKELNIDNMNLITSLHQEDNTVPQENSIFENHESSIETKEILTVDVRKPSISLEDEIAGMLEDRSYPELGMDKGSTPEPTFDLTSSHGEMLNEEDDDPFGFSHVTEENKAVETKSLSGENLMPLQLEGEFVQFFLPSQESVDLPVALKESYNMTENKRMISNNQDGASELSKFESKPDVLQSESLTSVNSAEASLPNIIDEAIIPNILICSVTTLDVPSDQYLTGSVESTLGNPISDQVEPPLHELQESTSIPAFNATPEDLPPSNELLHPTLDSSLTKPTEQMIPASVLDEFTKQLHRLEENHHLEIQEMQSHHEEQLAIVEKKALQQLEATRSELQQGYLLSLKEKEEHFQEVMHINEGMELKMNALKREVAGTRKLVEDKEREIESLKEKYVQEKKLLEQNLRKSSDSFNTSQADIYQLQGQLKAVRAELEESNDAYAALKSRVKTVATELKERRVECRTLATTNVELTETNEQLSSTIASLQAQLDDRDRSEVEKGEERDSLHEKIKTLEETLAEAEKKIQERDAVGEKALAAYKKKAQSSLAVANARAAAALQAKEEAELEARAARSTADIAVDRARKAEAKGNEALAEAKAYVKDMEVSLEEWQAKANESKKALHEVELKLKKAITDEESARGAKEKLVKEIAALNHEMQIEKNKSAELLQDYSDLQKRSNDLYDEVETLREELRKNATAAFMANHDGKGMEHNGSGMDLPSRLLGPGAAEKSESEGTIVMLQRELRDANQAIKELKETLRSTLEIQMQNIGTTASVRGQVDSTTMNPASASNDSTPLFFAMEKQAELNQAREEINRLAGLLAELQSEKEQAMEAVENMAREKAAAEARLARFGKLGTVSKRPMRVVRTGGYGGLRMPVESDSRSIGSVDSMDSMDGPNPESSQINLEYLKNVMLSYLNAKTLNERKRLVPAVAAVLCLTPDETNAAIKSVIESGSVESVGLSFFEGLKLV